MILLAGDASDAAFVDYDDAYLCSFMLKLMKKYMPI